MRVAGVRGKRVGIVAAIASVLFGLSGISAASEPGATGEALRQDSNVNVYFIENDTDQSLRLIQSSAGGPAGQHWIDEPPTELAPHSWDSVSLLTEAVQNYGWAKYGSANGDIMIQFYELDASTDNSACIGDGDTVCEVWTTRNGDPPLFHISSAVGTPAH